MSAKFLLGTDNLGRDLLSRHDLRRADHDPDRRAGDAAVLFASGAILGFAAAVVGGWFDMLMSRFVDLLMAIPTLIFGARRALGPAIDAG